MNIRICSVHHYHGTLAGFSPEHPGYTVNRIVKRLASLREQIFIGKLSSHSCINNRSLAVIVELDASSVKAYIDKVVALLVVAQTDSDRRDHKGINSQILMMEYDLAHDFTTADSNSFGNELQLSSK